MKSDRELGRMRAVVLAGGKGTRLAPYTTVLPKPLIPVGDMPVLEILLRQLRHAGVRDVTLSVGHLASLIEAYFGDGRRLGVEITYSREEEPLGTAGPLARVPDLTDPFLVMNGDLLTTLDFREMVRAHRDEGPIATVGLFTKEVKIDLGVIEADKTGRVREYVEKPTLTYEVSTGMYVMGRDVLGYVAAEQHLDLPDLIRMLNTDGHFVYGYRFDGHWLDIGRHEDLETALDLIERDRAAFLPGE